MKEKTPWQKQYHKVRDAVIVAFGGKCFGCDKKLTRKTAEFSHIEVDEEFNGGSRGSWKRITNVMKHPSKYGMACNACHKKRDIKLGIWKWQVAT